MTRLTILTGTLLALVMAGAAAGQPVNPKPATPAPKAVAPPAAAADGEIEGVMRMLTGTFVSPAPAGATENGAAPLRLSSARIAVKGASNTVYFEVARDDSWAWPFRQGVFQVYRRQGELRLRVCDFRGREPGFEGAVAGLWMAPDVFPEIESENLWPNVEFALSKSGGTYTGVTAGPVPTARDRATELTSEVVLSDGSVALADRGWDASGKQVWGVPAGASYAFKRAAPKGVIQRLDGGLVVIDFVPPKEGETALAFGGKVAVQYTGWLSDGFRFDTSRLPGRPPYETSIPGSNIAGWQKGMIGVTKGTHRKLVIPPELGFGERGQPRAKIPANATLIFETECVWLENAAPKPASDAKAGEPGADAKPEK
ncbi:MAG: FKBP-type peptidyl-prolyl cis-trans isomerase [Phycisphaerae bacterium]|nr:FKBP-type peptidyl-prolyl cis-trans isomerase [Phycisphaerae bacterium]